MIRRPDLPAPPVTFLPGLDQLCFRYCHPGRLPESDRTHQWVPDRVLTFHRWKSQYGGMELNELQQLRKHPGEYHVDRS